MTSRSRRRTVAIVLGAAVIGTSPLQGRAHATLTPATSQQRVGIASYYGRMFAGRKMADGTPMRLDSDSAASRTLPLGTIAKVVNLLDGKTAIVTIRDRGPYAKGRIIDLSPHTARQLGMMERGLAHVAVIPMTGPQPTKG